MIRRRRRTSRLATSLFARVAAVAALALGLGFPAAAATAAPAAIDPGCDIYTTGGFFEVQDPAETPAGLPPQITTADMSCIITISGQNLYVYLTDPFVVFIDKTNAFVADGWTVTEFQDDDTEIPVDLAALPGRQADPEIALHFVRGFDQALIYYSPDGVDATYGPGTIVMAFPTIGGGGGADLDEPSTISDLRTIGDSIPNAPQAGVLIVSASLLTLLLAIPAFLLSRVLNSRYAQLFGWLERGRIGRLRNELAKPANETRRWLFLGIGMALAAFIAGFIDPRFGFNGLSVRLFLTLLATFVLFNVGAWAVITLVLRRVQPDARPALTFHPATLIVVAVAVLLSRLLDFDPGLVFGLVAGTTFAVALARSKEAIVIITGTAYAAVVALLAWIVYSALNAGGPPDNGLLVAISELLGGITIEGVSTLPIALIPLATLDGAILFAWRRWVWAAVYAIGLALFMLVLFTLPGGDQPADGDFVRWIIVFVVFAVLATGVWLADYLVRRRGSPTPTAAAT